MSDREKIKSLTVSNFRAFSKKQTFDFEDSDLIIIYGLNGLGKTSMFDSIEWGLTGKIGRYEKYLINRKQQIQSEENMLTNKYCFDQETEAIIELSSGKSFGRRVQKSKGLDYNSGVEIPNHEFGIASISNTEFDPNFCNSYFLATHLLSQDVIHHFITENKPGERFNSISVNFGTSVFTPFKGNINKLITFSKNKLDSIDKALVDRKSRISHLKNNLLSDLDMGKDEMRMLPDRFTKFLWLEEANLLVKDLESFLGSDEFGSKPFDKKSSFFELENRVKMQLTELANRKKDLLYLSMNYDENSAKQGELKKLNEENSIRLKKLNKINGLKKDLDLIKAKNEDESEKVEKINSRLSEVRFVQRNFSTLVQSSKLEKVLKHSLEHFAKRRDLIQDRILSAIDKEGNKISDNLEKTDQCIAAKTDSLDYIVKNRRLLESFEDEQKKIEDEAERLRELLRAKKADTDSLEKLKFILENTERAFVDQPTKSQIIVLEKNDFSSKLQSFNKCILDLIGHRETKEKKLQEKALLKNKREHLVKLGDEREQLIKSAIQLVSHHVNDAECPVCHTDFHTHANLTKTISKQLNEFHFSELEAASKSLTKLQNDLEALDADIDKRANEVKHSRLSLVETITLSLQDIEKEANDSRKRLVTYEEQILKNETVLKTAMTKMYPEGAEDAQRISAEEIQTLEKSIFESKQKRQELSEGRTKSKRRYRKFESRLRKLENRLERIKSEREALFNEQLLEVKEKAESLNINSKENRGEEKINEILEKHVGELKATNEVIASNLKEIKKLQEEVSNTLGDDTEGSLAEKVATVKDKVDEISAWIEKYNERRRSTTKDVPEKEYYKSELIRTDKNIKKYDDISLEFENSLDLVEDYNKWIENSMVRKQISELEKETENLEAKKRDALLADEKIADIRRHFPKQLESFVSSVVNEKLLNKIHKALNPHIRFNELHCDLETKRNRTQLGITAEERLLDKDGKERIISTSPEFTFSSAQLNTLGVSIFLSMNLNQRWLNLDTVLLDDPIQNLDDINILSFVDLLRALIENHDRQVFISTHDERFYRLLQRKFARNNSKVKCFEYSTYGEVLQLS